MPRSSFKISEMNDTANQRKTEVIRLNWIRNSYRLLLKPTSFYVTLSDQ